MTTDTRFDTVSNIPSPNSAFAMERRTEAATIANFRPTPKEIISGIAPHVFDERRRRPRRTSLGPYRRRPSYQGAIPESSPLRVAAGPRDSFEAEETRSDDSAAKRSAQEETPANCKSSRRLGFRIRIQLFKAISIKFKGAKSQFKL